MLSQLFVLTFSGDYIIFLHLLIKQLPVGATDAELEDRIIQHLAAAAAMGRARHLARREGQRTRASAQGRPRFVVFSTNTNAPSATASPSPTERGDHETDSSITISGSPVPLGTSEDSVEPNTVPHSVQSVQESGSRVIRNQYGTSPYRFVGICFPCRLIY